MERDALLSFWYHRPPTGPQLPSNGRLCTLHSRCAHIGEKETTRRAVSEPTHYSFTSQTRVATHMLINTGLEKRDPTHAIKVTGVFVSR